MNSYEIEEWAQYTAESDNPEFVLIVNGRVLNGKFLDAFFGMIQLPDLGDGFMMLSDLRKQIGDQNMVFIPQQ